MISSRSQGLHWTDQPIFRVCNRLLAALWGAAAFPLYAISIAHANDHATAKEFVEVSSGMLLIYVAGSVVGPLVASVVIDQIGSSSLYAFIASALILLGAYTIWRVKQRVAPPIEEHVAFKEALAAAQTISEAFDVEIQREHIAQTEGHRTCRQVAK